MANDLEQRAFIFAGDVRDFCRKLKFDVINTVYIKQLIRSSCSIGANYIEANENLGKGDLRMKLKISRKEAKESAYWLQLLIVDSKDLHLLAARDALIGEVTQLRKILSAILVKVQ